MSVSAAVPFVLRVSADFRINRSAAWKVVRRYALNEQDDGVSVGVYAHTGTTQDGPEIAWWLGADDFSDGSARLGHAYLWSVLFGHPQFEFRTLATRWYCWPFHWCRAADVPLVVSIEETTMLRPRWPFGSWTQWTTVSVRAGEHAPDSSARHWPARRFGSRTPGDGFSAYVRDVSAVYGANTSTDPEDWQSRQDYPATFTDG